MRRAPEREGQVGQFAPRASLFHGAVQKIQMKIEVWDKYLYPGLTLSLLAALYIASWKHEMNNLV